MSGPHTLPSRGCCQAGAVAYPEPCPWHPPHQAAPGDQPPPIPNDGPSAHEHAVAVRQSLGIRDDHDAQLGIDLLQRAAVGLKRYGTKLQPHNGRDAAWDGYQEALDAVAYAAQVHLEALSTIGEGSIGEGVARELLAAAWEFALRWETLLVGRPRS